MNRLRRPNPRRNRSRKSPETSPNPRRRRKRPPRGERSNTRPKRRRRRRPRRRAAAPPSAAGRGVRAMRGLEAGRPTPSPCAPLARDSCLSSAAAIDVLAFHPDNLEVDGGAENWHPSRAFTVRWDDPRVRRRRRPLPGPAKRTARNPIGAGPPTPDHPTESLSIDVRDIVGAYTVEVWLQDRRQPGPDGHDEAALRQRAAEGTAPHRSWAGSAAPRFPTRCTSAIRATRSRSPASRATPSRSTRTHRANPCAAADRCSDAETDLRGGPGDDSLPVAGLPKGRATSTRWPCRGRG